MEVNLVSFSPYIFIETEQKRPSSLSSAAWCGNSMKYIEINLTKHGPEDKRTPVEYLPSVQDVVREHFIESKGMCLLYGPITGYRYVISETESILLTTAAQVVKQQRGKFWPKSISMTVEE
jgi:hypothetical protein